MTKRSMLPAALTLLTLPALAGLTEVSHAQPLPAAVAVQGGGLLRMTAPSYPLAAKQASVSGVVTVEARIGADGRVVQTSVLRGPSSLRRSAQHSVGNWRFEPTILNGKPVERVAEVDLRFVLGRY